MHPTEQAFFYAQFLRGEVNGEAVTQATYSKSKLTVDELMPSVYDDLRRVAYRYLLGEAPGNTLRPTALVNEAYVKLAGQRTEWRDKSRFMAVVARVMRHILVDRARAQRRQKRGLRPLKVTLNDTVAVAQNWTDLLELDSALQRLGEHDRRKAQIIELLFFGGLTYDECAEVLHISAATLYRELRMAKAWLYRELAPVEKSA